MTDVGELKRTARALWGRGEYVPIAKRLEPAARALVDACAISAGQEVLDVAAGNGNVATLAAREGAAVVASDLSPAMVELGRMRTETEGLDVERVEADAEELPFENARLDCAGSLQRDVRPPARSGRERDLPRGAAGRDGRDGQ